MINLTIDGNAVSVPEGTTVYNAAKELGIPIPIFCYLDRMPPFGACRMCLVEVEKMPKLQASCTLNVSEGMVVNTISQKAVQGRNEIIEFLLLNHPLDCPICDRGGECPLQENALDHGAGVSRFFEDKRHFKKPIPLGPVLMLDRERCIVCARCTRFGDLLAGDHALEFIDRGYRTEVGTPGGGPVDSKFIGNTIMICPVGALTSQVYRFRARPWDNEPTETTCTLCPVGCSMILDSRDGEIMRTRSFEDKKVNDMWLCDKGWFGYEFTYNPERLTLPLVRVNGKLEETSWEKAFSFIAEKIISFKPNGKLGAIGGNTLTTEENYLFQQLMRKGLGVNNVDHRVDGFAFTLDEEGLSPGMDSEIEAAESYNYVFLFGLDLTEEFPVIWLRLRQAINKGAKVIFAGHFAPEIANLLSEVHLHTPGKEIEAIQNLKLKLKQLQGQGALFIGNQYLQSAQRKEILKELTSFGIPINVMEGSNNSLGARFAGMHPELGPQGEILSKPGLSAFEMLKAAAQDSWDFLYIAGADIASKYKKSLWNNARKNLKFLLVQDLFLTETAKQADVVLPVLSYVEKGGTFINIEGRVQKILPGKVIPETIYSDGRIFAEIGERISAPLATDPNFLNALKTECIRFKRKEDWNPSSQSGDKGKGSFACSFAPKLFDHGVRMEHNPHLFEVVKEASVRLNPEDAKAIGIKCGEKIKAVHGENQVFAKAKVDTGVAPKTAVFPLGFPEVPSHELAEVLLNGLLIDITKES